MVNGRGREDTCSIIRPDKEGQAEGGIEGGWEDDGAFGMSVLFIFIAPFFLQLEINIMITKICSHIELHHNMINHVTKADCIYRAKHIRAYFAWNY